MVIVSAQVLYIKQHLLDFIIKVKNIMIKYDNASAINISKNHIQYSLTKHIKVRYHFIGEHVQNKMRSYLSLQVQNNN